MTLIDGLVLARSVFNHSVNYRSAILFGHGEAISDSDEKLRALHCFMEKQLPGRWADARQPNEQEVKATGVISLPLATASAKVRIGPPKDDDADLELPVWAGVLPLQQRIGEPVPAPEAPADSPLPTYLEAYLAAHRTAEATHELLSRS
jgi:hypothetical protein